MHAGGVGWAGQAFALATSNDSGGRKSRIRRSKEERKSMVESFIKKYQASNNGNFPSLNLAHKEVGGSFYTVREIVREIIQENRVLAPPKVSIEEHEYFVFVEEHPLGSISMDPQIGFSGSERVHMETHIMPDKYQTSSENISSSSESYPLELENEQMFNAVNTVVVTDQDSDNMSIEEVSNFGRGSPLLKGNEFEDEKIVNGLDGSHHLDESLVTNDDHRVNIDGSHLSSENISVLENGGFDNVQNYNNDIVDENEEFVQRIHVEPAVLETPYTVMSEAQNIETLEAIRSPMNSGVVVETFPLRPVTKTIHNMDEEFGKLQDTAGRLEDKTIQHIKKTHTQGSISSVNIKGEGNLSDSTVESNGDNKDEKVAPNLQGPSVENAKSSLVSKPSVLVAELESKVSVLVAELESEISFPDTTEAISSTNTSISDDSIVVGGKSSNQENGCLPKGNNPTLDRINLETWDGASNKSSRPESNPLLALVKAFITSFVKFWLE